MISNYHILYESPLIIQEEADIVDVRQQVRNLAEEYEFNSFAQSALITVASELSRNIWTHAGSGKVLIIVIDNNHQIGLQLEFEDQGPGIEDVNRVMLGGYSTARSLGLGLSGSKRLVDEFNIETAPGKGTKIVVRKWKRKF